MKRRAVVLGDGAWGTAIATVLAHNGIEVALWCYDASVAHTITHERVNHRYLADVQLSPLITPITDIHHALSHSDYVFSAIPVIHVRSVLRTVSRAEGAQKIWVLLSKGMEVDTDMFSSEIVQDLFGRDVCCMVVAGPSFAAELAREQCTSMVLAADQNGASEKVFAVAQMLTTPYVRLAHTDDVKGVQCASMYKNIIALAVGIAQGAGYGENTQAALITSCLAALSERVVRCGGSRDTVYGLAGVGDVILTAKGGLSKNVLAGRQLGMGSSLADLEREWTVLPEGINSCLALLAQKGNDDRLVKLVGGVLKGTLSAEVFVQKFL